MKLSDIVKNYRMAHGLSMDDMAARCGRTKPYIHQLENGNPKTGKEIQPGLDTIVLLAKAMNMEIDELVRMLNDDTVISLTPMKKIRNAIRIPVLGKVVAGVPIEATQDVLGYVEITERMAKTGDYFALRIKGDSMMPNICDGDTVIVKKQESVESGDIAIILVNGSDATCKKVKLNSSGITLIGYNPSVYEPHFYTNEEITTMPITIIGKVVELRRAL